MIHLVQEVRNGSLESQNHLMGQLRSYFHVLAQFELSPEMQRKIGNSDIVQQSCVRVVEAIDGFRGTTEGEMKTWLMR